MIVEERLTTYIDSLNWQIPACLKEVEKEAEKETARGTGDTQTADPASREAPEQKSREVQIQNAQRQKAVSDAVKTKEQKIRAARETPRNGASRPKENGTNTHSAVTVAG